MANQPPQATQYQTLLVHIVNKDFQTRDRDRERERQRLVNKWYNVHKWSWKNDFWFNIYWLRFCFYLLLSTKPQICFTLQVGFKNRLPVSHKEGVSWVLHQSKSNVESAVLNRVDWFGLVLWHINHYRLFDTKSSLDIYIIYTGFAFWGFMAYQLL